MSNEKFFDQNTSPRFQKSIARLVLENYRASSRFVYRHFAGPQAKDLSGVYRRAMIEENLSGLPVLFPEVSVENKAYENNTGFYNEITCQQVKLTQSCIVDTGEVPRTAKFRSTLAQTGQLSLFENHDADDGEGENDPRFMYAILTHRVDVMAEKRAWPAFIRIQFPNASSTKYLDEGINLLARFPELIAEYIPKSASQFKRRRRRGFGAS